MYEWNYAVQEMIDWIEENMEENYVSDIDIISALKTIKSKNPRVIIDELMKICKVSGNAKDDISILVGVLWKNN